MIPREIRIKPVLNGFVCKVGCQTVVFTSIKDLVRDIERYYKDPMSVEKEYLTNGINKEVGPVPAPEPVQRTMRGDDVEMNCKPAAWPEPCPECAQTTPVEEDWP